MKFASVKQAVKFGIGAGLPPDKQTSVKTVKCLKCQTTTSPPPWYEQQYQIDTHFNYYVNTYKSTL